MMLLTQDNISLFGTKEWIITSLVETLDDAIHGPKKPCGSKIRGEPTSSILTVSSHACFSTGGYRHTSETQRNSLTIL